MEDNHLIEIQNESSGILNQAENIKINCKEDYYFATDFMRNIMNMKQKISTYWKEPKKQAADAHKAIVKKEKEMLEPIENCEKILRRKISLYITEQKKLAMLEEEIMKKQREELAMKQLEEAEKMRKEGNELEATIVEQNAIAISEIETKIEDSTKIDGVSYRKDYKIIVTNPNEVPAYINGIQIREIDLSAIKKIIKMTDGQIKINGINVEKILIPIIKK